MFGSDDNQPFGVPAGAPANNDDIMKNGSLEQADTVSDAHQPNDGAATQPSDPASIFPPSSINAADPFGTAQASPAPVAPSVPASAADDTTTSMAGGDAPLLDIKQQALQHLSPLVQHLDQSADEKFKTTMMMIQASDDKSLVPVAFEAAKQIEDDKNRAQALLDIINEINYFTQQ